MIKNHLAIVFPGQGSQSVGMLSDIAQQHQEVEMIFNQASAVLGYDLWRLTQDGPASQLDQTMYTQPALLSASYAIWHILQKEDAWQPAILAGHSLGEYTALVCAQALQFTDAIQLVAARGHFMQEAVPEGMGAMAAIIGLDDNQLNALCKEAIHSSDEILTPANFNSIGQVVVAGHRAAVMRLVELSKAAGAKLAVLLPVSVPSHCALMKPAAERLSALLADTPIQVPIIPVVNNVDATLYNSPDAIRDGLVRQLYLPVRWVEIIQGFVDASFDHIAVTTVLECGPGKILTGLNKRIAKQLRLMTTADLANLDSVQKQIGENA